VTADTLRELLIIGLLIGLNAVFVAAEIALVTARRSRLDQLASQGNRSARRARAVVANPARFLAVIQLGITFIGFLASAYAAVSLTLALEHTLDDVEFVASYSEALALVIVTGVLSVVTFSGGFRGVSSGLSENGVARDPNVGAVAWSKGSGDKIVSISELPHGFPRGG
jgi:CBS domain containing-hemolysin-like protein